MFNYFDIIKVTDTFISLKLNKLIINIRGKDLLITRLEKKEILIKGIIDNLERIYE